MEPAGGLLVFVGRGDENGGWRIGRGTSSISR